MLSFPKSRIFQPSAIVGGARRLVPHEVGRAVRRLSASLTLKLVVLVSIFVALPMVLYGQFENADRHTRELVIHSIQHRSWLVAQALRPILDRAEEPPHKTLNNELRKYSDDGTSLKLMLQPSEGVGDKNFYYVASAPRVGSDQLAAELDSLWQHGILQHLSESCTWDSPTEIRYKMPDGTEEILTSVIPIETRWGCWVVVSAHATTEYLNSSIGRGYWQTREVHIAAFSYIIVAVLGLLIAVSVGRNLSHFRKVAREIRQGRGGQASFSARNVVPELTSVAMDFDRLVADLRSVARDIRQAAEDNAHSFKAPIATIQASLEPLRRVLPGEDRRAQRAVGLIDSSLTRLHALVVAAQRLDNNTADLIDAPRSSVNVTQLVADTLRSYREVMAERQIRLTRRLDENAIVDAGKGMIEGVVENILDNAISFSSPQGVIAVTLTKGRETMDLKIEDEGPGIDPKKIERIFERYVSLRPREQSNGAEASDGETSDHAGLGLWIVRRNVETLGGRVSAANRLGGGLAIHVVLPLNGR